MQMPLNVALDIGRVISIAQAEQRSVDIQDCAAELFLRFPAAGCSRQQISEALQGEAEAVGVSPR